MILVQQKTITYDDVTTNVAETTPTAWSAGTYNLNDEVRHEHHVWTSLIGSNTAEPGTDDGAWRDDGATNAYKMFDTTVWTQTENTDNITVTIPCGMCDYIALFGLEADQVQLVIAAGGVEVSNETISLRNDVVTDWFEYFFAEFEYRADFVHKLPIYHTASLQIILTKTGTVKCGHVVAGRGFDVGSTQLSPRSGGVDYSYVSEDDFGNPTIVKRRNVKTMELSTFIPAGRVDAVKKKLAAILATPAVWMGDNEDDGFESLIVFGLLRDHNITIDHPVSTCDIQIRGMI